MKKKSTFLFLFLILSFQCSFAQNGWKNATKTADSLDLEKQFEASLPFRIKAVETAKNAPGSIQKTLLGLKDRKITRLNSSHYCVSSMPCSDCKKKKNSLHISIK